MNTRTNRPSQYRLNENEIEIYRSYNPEKGYCHHNRKKCECGKIITDKQLKQFKMCKKCYAETKA